MRRNRNINYPVVIALCFIILFIAASLVAFHYHAEVAALRNGVEGTGNGSGQAMQVQSAAEVSAIVEQVGKLILLPQGETPTVATVSNPDMLSSQPFFKDASKGDVVLIYTVSKEAILFDPSENKIVAVAPISLGAASSSDGTSGSASQASSSTSKNK